MVIKRKDYASIAAAAMYRPADNEGPHKARKKKILVYSRNKKGKSTFSASAPNVLIADPEWGVTELKERNPHVWPIKQWADMDDFYKFCRLGLPCPVCKEEHYFDWVAIDGMTKLSNMSLRHVMKIQQERDLDRTPGMVQRQDYGKSGELVKEMMSLFNNLDLGVIYTAQERQDAPFQGDDDEDAEENVVSYVPDLPKGVRGSLTSLVDVIGRLYVVRIENKEGKVVPERRLWVGPSTSYDTGYRSDFVLPDVIRQPTVPKVVRLMTTGSTRIQK